MYVVGGAGEGEQHVDGGARLCSAAEAGELHAGRVGRPGRMSRIDRILVSCFVFFY